MKEIGSHGSCAEGNLSEILDEVGKWNKQHQLKNNIENLRRILIFSATSGAEDWLIMVSSHTSGLFLALSIVTVFGKSQANDQQPGDFQIITSSFGVNAYMSDCVDFSGRKIKHGSHFIQRDSCQMCVCDSGNGKKCRTVLCAPPHGCKSWRMGAACCEFTCLDQQEAEEAEVLRKRLMVCGLFGFVLLLVGLCVLYHNSSKCREKLDQLMLYVQVKIQALRSLSIKRDRSKAEGMSETKIESISSQLSLREDTNLRKPETISRAGWRPEVMDELKKQIEAKQQRNSAALSDSELDGVPPYTNGEVHYAEAGEIPESPEVSVKYAETNGNTRYVEPIESDHESSYNYESNLTPTGSNMSLNIKDLSKDD